MEDITSQLGKLYYPTSALVFYQTKDKCGETYVEHFDMDSNGNPINAHPLSEREAEALAKALIVKNKKEKQQDFLKPVGILPSHILHVNPSEKASVIWFTKAMQRPLFFTENLEIPNGTAQVPAMLWYADKRNLRVFALATNQRPTEETPLYYAPFFNVYENGSVCMGTVDIQIKNSSSLEEFISTWENYFFNSYLSHLMNEFNPVKGNCVSLWKNLINTDKVFPKKVLKKSTRILKDLL